MRHLAAAAAFVIGAAILGCGSNPEDGVRQTAETVFVAFKDADGEKACGLVIDAARAEMEADGKSCEEEVRSSQAVKGDLTVDDVRVDGNRASARIEVEGGGPVRWGFVKTDGEWKVSEFDSDTSERGQPAPQPDP